MRHEEEGGRYVYSPAVPRHAARKSALKHLVETFFDGSAEQVVAARARRRSVAAVRRRPQADRGAGRRRAKGRWPVIKMSLLLLLGLTATTLLRSARRRFVTRAGHRSPARRRRRCSSESYRSGTCRSARRSCDHRLQPLRMLIPIHEVELGRRCAAARTRASSRLIADTARGPRSDLDGWPLRVAAFLTVGIRRLAWLASRSHRVTDPVLLSIATNSRGNWRCSPGYCCCRAIIRRCSSPGARSPRSHPPRRRAPWSERAHPHRPGTRARARASRRLAGSARRRTVAQHLLVQSADLDCLPAVAARKRARLRRCGVGTRRRRFGICLHAARSRARVPAASSTRVLPSARDGASVHPRKRVNAMLNHRSTEHRSPVPRPSRLLIALLTVALPIAGVVGTAQAIATSPVRSSTRSAACSRTRR